jgi:hypothetical protein
MLAIVSEKLCQIEQVQFAAVMPPRAMSSKSSRENFEITKPSMMIASSNFTIGLLPIELCY